MADGSSAERTSKTLFVRNLAFSITQKDLEKAFEDHGPIKSCFLITDRATGKSRGLGYVIYSVREDAEKAFAGVKSIQGRKVFIKYADPSLKKGRKQKGKGPPQESESEKPDDEVPADEPKIVPPVTKIVPSVTKVTKEKPAVPKQLSAKQLRHKNVSTVVLNGAKAGSAGDVEKLLCKLGIKTVRSIEIPTHGEDNTAYLGCKSNKDAKKVRNKINNQEKGGVSAILFLDVEKTPKKVSEKRCKLIVRNLSFKCDVNELKEAFKTYGKITDASIPVNSKGLKFGYGFVQFSNLDEANKALKAMNSKSIKGRAVAVDWALEREKFQQAKSVDEKSNAADDKSDDDAEEGSSGDEDEDSDRDTSKQQVKKTPKNAPVKHDNGSENEEESSADDDSEAIDSGNSSGEEEVSDDDESEDLDENEEKDDSNEESDDSNEESDIGDSDEEGDDSDDESSDDESTQKKKKFASRPSDVGEGKTLFVRNVSFDSEEDDLEELFGEFGEIALCRLVIDRETEHSKGVAFVKFKNKEDAEKCLEQSQNEQLRSGGIVLDGRKLLVSLAVAKADAQKLKKDKDPADKKKDSRNLWLIREGMVRAGTQAAQGVPNAELRMREQIDKAKRNKLKNPEIFVSPTRLCIHNIPTRVRDADLRKLFLKAAQNKSANVIECRIMRDLNRVNASGVGKSRGFAFVAFDNHEHALAALRYTNNNPDLYKEDKRLIVEFSLENRAALRTKQLRLERAQSKQHLFKKEKGQRKQRSGKLKVGVVQAPPKGSNVVKGMPSHMGPKIRHKKREIEPPKKKTKKPNNQQKQAFKQQAPISSEPPAKKKKSNKARQRTDDVDKLVAKYRSNFNRDAVQKMKKWFES